MIARLKLLLTIVAMSCGAGLVSGSVARADLVVSGSFGPNGDVGFVYSPPTLSITFGTSGNGSIYQMDGFVNASNYNLNNNNPNNSYGTSAELTYGAPTGMTYTFAETAPTVHELLMTYTFVNTTGVALQNFQFMHFVDGDIGPNYTDEWATTKGTLSSGYPATTPSSFQVGDPSTSTLFNNLLFGTLSNSNAFPNSGQAGDVAWGLGLSAGTLGINQKVVFSIMLSDDSSALPGFSITQNDPVYTGDTLTVSGSVALAAVPEPSSFFLAGLGAVGFIAVGVKRSRKTKSPETIV